MGESTPLDDRGRFTVDPRFRKLLGRRVVQVLTPEGVLLRPAADSLPPGSLPPAQGTQGDRLYWAEERRKRRAPRR